jgi:GT2 family glycosyltransferase
MPTVTVVTPWFQHREFMPGYWDALEAGEPDEVIIVDNGSDPPLDFADVRLQTNTGFCPACNVGLDRATSDAVLFLNNDVDLGRANWLREIRAKIAPKRLVGEVRRGDHASVDGVMYSYVDGWCIAAMRDDLVELGGWDETLTEPAYYSDNLLSLRAEQTGWELVNVNVGLRHLVSGTARDNWGRITRAAAANRTVWEQAVRQPLASVT